MICSASKFINIPYDKERAEKLDNLIRDAVKGKDDQIETLFDLLPKKLSKPQLDNLKDLSSFEIKAEFELAKIYGNPLVKKDAEKEISDDEEPPKEPPKRSTLVCCGLRFLESANGVLELTDPTARFCGDSPFNDGIVQCNNGKITVLTPGKKTIPNGYDLYDLFNKTLKDEPTKWLAEGKCADYVDYHNGNLKIPADLAQVDESSNNKRKQHSPRDNVQSAGLTEECMTFEEPPLTQEDIDKLVEGLRNHSVQGNGHVKNYRQNAESQIKGFKQMKGLKAGAAPNETKEKTVSDYIEFINKNPRKPTKESYGHEYSCELMQVFFITFGILFTIHALKAINVGIYKGGLAPGYFSWLDDKDNSDNSQDGDEGE